VTVNRNLLQFVIYFKACYQNCAQNNSPMSHNEKDVLGKREISNFSAPYI